MKSLPVVVIIFFLSLPYFLNFSKEIYRGPAADFEGSVLRDTNGSEQELGLQVLGCSGNFVKNNGNSVYVAAADHCIKFINSCFDIKVKFQSKSKGIIKGHCKKMLIRDKENDIILFKVELFDSDGKRYTPPEPSSFCLSSEPAKVGNELKVFHFPKIPQATSSSAVATAHSVSHIPKAKMKVSESCSAISTPVFCKACEDQQDVQWHNCPSYERSSGSGLIDVKTSCLVGVNHAADPTSDTYGKDDKAAAMAIVSRFVKKHNKQLQSLGVRIGKQREPGPGHNLKEKMGNVR